MIILTPQDTLRAAYTGTAPYYIAYVDLKGFASNNAMGTLSAAVGEITILESPSEGVRQIKYMSFFCTSGGTFDIFVQRNTDQGLLKRVFFECTPSAGDTIEYTNDEGFRLKDSNGNLKVTTGGGGGGGGNINISAGTTSNNLTNFVLSNSNGISFGLNGSTVTASHNGLTSQSNQALSGSNGSFTFQTATFGNLNGLSFYTSNGSMVGSYTVPAVTNSSWTISAGTTSNTVSGLTFADANSIVFGLDNGTVTASYNHNHTNNLYAVGNTTLSTSITNDLRSISYRGEGIVSVGVSNNSIVISATQSNQALSAQGGSSTFQTLSFNNANGLTFSNNGGAIEASYTVPTVTNSSFSVQDSATTINPVSRIAFSTGNNITATLSTAANHATVGFSHNLAGTSTGFNGNLISGSMTHNSSGLNLSLNHPAWLTTAMLSNAATISNINVSAGTTSNNLSAITFRNSNGITFGLDNSTMTASHNGLTSQSNQAFSAAGGSTTFQTLGFSDNSNASFTNTNGSVAIASLRASLYAVSNTTQSSSGTQNLNAVSFAGAGIASVGITNGSVVVSVPAGGGGGDGYNIINVNGAGSSLSATLDFVNSNGITFGLNASTITASHNGLTNINVSAGTTSNNLSNIVFSNSNGVTFGLNGSTVTASVAAAAGATREFYNPYGDLVRVAGQVGQATMNINPNDFPNITMDRIYMPINITNSSNSSGSHTLSFWLGIYTRNVSTLSLVTSQSTSYALTHSGTAGSYSLYSGMRHISMGLSTSLPEGLYYVAVVSRTTSGGANGSYSQMLASNLNSNFLGHFSSSHNTTYQFRPGLGVYSVTTSGIPNSIGISQIRGSDSLAQRPPIIIFANSTI